MSYVLYIVHINKVHYFKIYVPNRNLILTKLIGFEGL